MRRTALLLSLTACAAPAPPDARTAWLVEQIQRDNAIWMSRAPELLEAKYRRMASDPYDFMRGTVGVYLHDQARVAGERESTRFLRVVDAAQVLIVSDPHPENFGCFLPGPIDAPGPLRVEINDFDGATFGPWVWDVRRAAIGLRVLAHGIDACETDCADAAAEGLAEGYAGEIVAWDEGAPSVDPSDAQPSAVSARLLARCATRHAERRRFLRETVTSDTGRALRLDTALDERGRGTLPLTAEERAQVDRLSVSLLARVPHLRILDRARHYGRGVSSMPALRYLLLVDEGDASDADDRLLQLREVIDPPLVPGLHLPIEGPYASNAQRIEVAPRQMWSRPDADTFTFGLEDEGVSFKTLTWGSAFDGFDHDDIAEDFGRGRYDLEELTRFGAHLGRLLAAHHLRGLTAQGQPAADALVADLEGDESALVEEIVRSSRRHAAETLGDAERFAVALEQLGPLLGADLIYRMEHR